MTDLVNDGKKTIIDVPVGPSDALKEIFTLEVAPEGPAPVKLSADAGAAIARDLSLHLNQFPRAHFTIKRDMTIGVETPEQPVHTLTVTSRDIVAQKLTGIVWQQVKNLPGYHDHRVRGLGEYVFGSFECFRDYDVAMKAQGKDAQGEVLVCSTFTHDGTTVDHLAGLIKAHGVVVEVRQGELARFIPGYSPNIIVMMTADWTFKLVHERINRGQPVDLNSIYAWPGGLNAYRKKVELLSALTLRPA